MHAQIGDRLVVHHHQLGHPDKEGTIVELRHQDGTPPYLVRWSDSEQETLVFPGPDAHIEHSG